MNPNVAFAIHWYPSGTSTSRYGWTTSTDLGSVRNKEEYFACLFNIINNSTPVSNIDQLLNFLPEIDPELEPRTNTTQQQNQQQNQQLFNAHNRLALINAIVNNRNLVGNGLPNHLGNVNRQANAQTTRKKSEQGRGVRIDSNFTMTGGLKLFEVLEKEGARKNLVFLSVIQPNISFAGFSRFLETTKTLRVLKLDLSRSTFENIHGTIFVPLEEGLQKNTTIALLCLKLAVVTDEMLKTLATILTVNRTLRLIQHIPQSSTKFEYGKRGLRALTKALEVNDTLVQLSGLVSWKNFAPFSYIQLKLFRNWWSFTVPRIAFENIIRKGCLKVIQEEKYIQNRRLPVFLHTCSGNTKLRKVLMEIVGVSDTLVPVNEKHPCEALFSLKGSNRMFASYSGKHSWNLVDEATISQKLRCFDKEVYIIDKTNKTTLVPYRFYHYKTMRRRFLCTSALIKQAGKNMMSITGEESGSFSATRSEQSKHSMSGRVEEVFQEFARFPAFPPLEELSTRLTSFYDLIQNFDLDKAEILFYEKLSAIVGLDVGKKRQTTTAQLSRKEVDTWLKLDELPSNRAAFKGVDLLITELYLNLERHVHLASALFTDNSLYLCSFEVGRVKQDLESIELFVRTVRTACENAKVLLVAVCCEEETAISLEALDTFLTQQPWFHRGQFMCDPTSSFCFFSLLYPDRDVDKDLNHIREGILQFGNETKLCRVNVSLKAFQFFDHLIQTCSENNSPYLDYETMVEQLKAAFSSLSEELIKRILRYVVHVFSTLGIIISIETKCEVEQYVVFEPEWLVDKLSLVAFLDHEKVKRMSEELQSMMVEDYNLLVEKGLMTVDLLEKLWSVPDSQILIDFAKTKLVLHPCLMPGSVEKMYLIPSMLFDPTEWERSEAAARPCETCIVRFNEEHFSEGVFTRLCCLYASFQDQNGHQPRFFKDTAYFYQTIAETSWFSVSVDNASATILFAVFYDSTMKASEFVGLKVVRRFKNFIKFIAQETVQHPFDYQLFFRIDDSVDIPYLTAKKQSLQPWFNRKKADEREYQTISALDLENFSNSV